MRKNMIYNNSSKKRRILLEKRKKIKRIIKEELSMINEHIKVCDIVIAKEAEMRRRGIPQRVINESITDFLSSIPGGIWRYLKQYLGTMLMQKIGLNTESVLGYSLKNTIENMDFTHISKYFGGDCAPLVSLILKSFQEGLTEKGMDYIATAIFGRKLEGIFSGTAREIITQNLQEMTDQMREPLERAICDLDFSGLMSGLKGIFGNITDTVRSSATGAA